MRENIKISCSLGGRIFEAFSFFVDEWFMLAYLWIIFLSVVRYYKRQSFVQRIK